MTIVWLLLASAAYLGHLPLISMCLEAEEREP